MNELTIRIQADGRTVEVVGWIGLARTHRDAATCRHNDDARKFVREMYDTVVDFLHIDAEVDNEESIPVGDAQAQAFGEASVRADPEP